VFYSPLAGNSWSKGAKQYRGKHERETFEEHQKREKIHFNAILPKTSEPENPP
jgi:hypothetical protein